MHVETLAVRKPPQLRRPVPGRGRAQARRPARERGQDTEARLLAAGIAELGERSLQSVTVDDIVRRAETSHGTFYLYFASKEDLFRVLSARALGTIDGIIADFPVVSPDWAGRKALREWVATFCDIYAAHGPVFKILSQADVIGRDAWENGLKLWFRLVDAFSIGMTAGMLGQDRDAMRAATRNARPNAIACLMMLERMNYLLNSGVLLPKPEVIDRLTAIIIAAFDPAAAALT